MEMNLNIAENTFNQDNFNLVTIKLHGHTWSVPQWGEIEDIHLFQNYNIAVRWELAMDKFLLSS